jgi:uncharacterized iron-regulated membrane protein
MSNPRIWNRRLHRWGAAFVAVPFLVVIATGLLLQLKKQLDFVQPPEQRGRPSEVATTLSLPDVLARVQEIPEAGIRTWADVDRIDVRPAKQMLKVVSMTRWEIQLDLVTAEVLQVAYRRSDLIESLHDGSWFHPVAKLGLFFPTGVVVLGLWLTGIYLWFLPYWARRRAAIIRAARGEGPTAKVLDDAGRGSAGGRRRASG